MWCVCESGNPEWLWRTLRETLNWYGAVALSSRKLVLFLDAISCGWSCIKNEMGESDEWSFKFLSDLWSDMMYHCLLAGVFFVRMSCKSNHFVVNLGFEKFDQNVFHNHKAMTYFILLIYHLLAVVLHTFQLVHWVGSDKLLLTVVSQVGDEPARIHGHGNVGQEIAQRLFN